MERDPVCGMTVNPATAKWKAEHAGKTHYFCGERCLTKFRASPAQYLAPPGSPLEAAAPKRVAPRGSTYTFVYNLVGIPIAACVLYPALGWLLSPMIASAAMSLSSVSVISNALRLQRARVG